MPETIIINGRFLTAPATGVQRVARELVLGLDRSFARSPGDRQWRLLRPGKATDLPGLSQIASTTLAGPPGQLWEQVTFAREARSGLLVNLANTAPLSAKRSIVMIHDAQVFDAPESYSRAFRSWYRFMQPRVARKARVLTVSRHSAERLAAAGVIPDAASAVIIPNGVDHILRVTPSTDIIQRHDLAKRPFLLGFASAQKHKNTGLLLKIAEADLGADIFIALVGSGLPENTKPSSRIRLLGRVTDGELRALYEHAFAFLLPSATEGFGLPAGEAMLCGAPVMAADAGALREIWGAGAALASPDHPKDWIAWVRSLASDPALRQAASRRGADHAARYTWDASAALLRQVCEEASQT